jgi:predicted Zn-dependent protease
MEQIIERGERERPGLPSWLLQRGYIAMSRKDFGNATRYLKQANAARPEHLWTRWVLAVALIQSGKTSEARPLLLGLRDNPKTPAEIRSQVQQALK